MIEDISSRIADGADQTLKNGESMEEINQAIVRVNDMIAGGRNQHGVGVAAR
jgi:methyl-accepting chemotaxis protein-1 (serine sensor receptor)